jgi:hypothetical protein
MAAPINATVMRARFNIPWRRRRRALRANGARFDRRCLGGPNTSRSIAASNACGWDVARSKTGMVTLPLSALPVPR